ncbi:hypothetical protein G6F23_016030 [Rhizopus arrhizus]|nr:hypothetical protein G6F23_016030 [Rhizopus arrhizus]
MHDQRQRIDEQAVRHQLGWQRALADDAHVQAAIEQRIDLLQGVHLAQLQPHLRILLPVVQDRTRNLR